MEQGIGRSERNTRTGCISNRNGEGTTDKGQHQKEPCQEPCRAKGCQSMHHDNIHEVENTKLVSSHQEWRITQPLKKNYGKVSTGKEKKSGRNIRRWFDNTREVVLIYNDI